MAYLKCEYHQLHLSFMESGEVTIKDIARQLDISPSTVSRALKDHPDISRKTKDAVVELAARLDYHPNAIALNLRKNQTNTIGVIIPEIVHFFIFNNNQRDRRYSLQGRLQYNIVSVQ